MWNISIAEVLFDQTFLTQLAARSIAPDVITVQDKMSLSISS